MPLSVWTQPSGYSLGTLNERQFINILLPVSTTTGITFSVISGALPQGLRISGSNIVGTPFEVVRTTDYRFVIRASNGIEFSDRTFLFTVVGADESTWLTPAGLLPVGPNNAYYVIDSSFIDFQLSAVDTDTAAGQNLNFFIASDEGELPPGLILTPSGRITGFIQPLLAVPYASGEGAYDDGLYDQVAYDFGYRPSNGYDTYVFDSTVFDFSINTRKPRKLNRNYEFIATITDGDTVTKRKFRIFVVGEDFFRADNVILKSGEGTYTADVTYVRSPIFITPSYLGLKRANNYQTFKIDIYEGFGELGPVIFDLSSVNALINGVCVKELSSDNRLGNNFIRLEKSSNVPQEGYKISLSGELPNSTGTIYTITNVDVLGGDIYRLTLDLPLDLSIPNGTLIYLGTDSELPVGMQFDAVTSEVFGVVPYQPAITKNYTFTIKATRFGQGTEISTSRRVFNVSILGEVDSAMSWISPDHLGTIDTGYVSTLNVIAKSSIETSAVLYTLENGKLPPGLSLSLDGEIVGRVTQLQTQKVYRGYWKENQLYSKNDIIKQTISNTIKSVYRRRNTAFVVTTTDHNLLDNDQVKVISNNTSFNYYAGINIDIKQLKIDTPTITPVSGSYQITFSTPSQLIPPLAPTFTARGVSAGTVAWEDPVVVEQKSTSGNGTGAVFSIIKGSKPAGFPEYDGATTITVLDPGTGYLPGDTVTISGALLPANIDGTIFGIDGVNDLTFTITSGLEFYYRINGNSNSNYNGRFLATSSTSNSITLKFPSNPGTFGTGLISTQIDNNTYEAQTQIVPLNYFSYFNKGQSASMTTTLGTVYSPPRYFIATVDHNSGGLFDNAKWNSYRFTDEDQTITLIDGGQFTLDGNTTTVDRDYTFTIMARDQLGYSAIEKTFTISVNIQNQAVYSNIYVKPFLKLDQRSMFKDFIRDSEIFDPRYIYRLSDQYFGVQTELKMLVFAGIETKEAAKYIEAMGRNHKIKRFRFGDVKTAVAKVPGTNDEVYEVVYIEMIDPLEKEKKYLPSTIKYSATNVKITVDQTNEFYNGPFTIDSPHWKRPIPFSITLDRNDLFAGDPTTMWKFPSSISLWRRNIKNMSDTIKERNYLPLWMRSIQPNTTQEIDFVAAVPLCYCKPGTASEIVLNIKNSNFDFKNLDYTVDRYIIDSVTGDYTDKYLVFRNDRTTIT
jgi:hypothetical protein